MTFDDIGTPITFPFGARTKPVKPSFPIRMFDWVNETGLSCMTFEEPAGEKMTLPDGKRAVPVATRYGVVVVMTFVVMTAVSTKFSPPLFPAKNRYLPVPGDH